MTLTIHTAACPLAHTSDGECIGCKETFTITPRVVPAMTEAEETEFWRTPDVPVFDLGLNIEHERK